MARSKGLVALLALLAPSESLRTSPTRDVPSQKRKNDPTPPDFYACEGEEGEASAKGCERFSDMPWVPSRSMDSLLKVGYRRMREQAAFGRKPMAVHVGADGLRSSARWTDTHLYKRVLARAGLPKGLPRLAFVEALESKSRDFWDNTKLLDVKDGQVSLTTALMDGKCKAPEETFYTISPRAAKEFDFDYQLPEYWASMKPRHPLNVIGYWASHNLSLRCYNATGDCKANFQRFSRRPDIDSYIDKLSIPCLTLEGLVKEQGARVRDLGMLVVDAEGMDATILMALVEHMDFNPGFIMWETGPTPTKDDAKLTQMLRKRGYEVGEKLGQVDGKKWDFKVDAANRIAVRKGIW